MLFLEGGGGMRGSWAQKPMRCLSMRSSCGRDTTPCSANAVSAAPNSIIYISQGLGLYIYRERGICIFFHNITLNAMSAAPKSKATASAGRSQQYCRLPHVHTDTRCDVMHLGYSAVHARCTKSQTLH